MSYFVYVIHNEARGRRYTGISEDPQRRLKEHNRGRTKSTKPYRPWRLIYCEEYSSRAKAREREKYLKTGSGREFLDKILDP